MTSPVDDPDELHALAATAIEHALGSIPGSGAFGPFALVEDASGVALLRVDGDQLEVMLEQTRAVVTDRRPRRAVVVWDGYTSYTGERLDSVLAEAYESGAAGGIVIAQPYRRAGLLKKRVEPVGTGAVIQRGTAPLFAG